MADDTPAHRHTRPARSGDDHLIDAYGTLRNLDQERRDAETAAAAKKPGAKRATPETPAE